MTTTQLPPTGPGTVLKASASGGLTTLAWALADASRPDVLVALGVSALGDFATWLVPNDAEHPRWYRRAAKAVVCASSAGLAAVPLALGQWEGDGGDLSVAGLWLQMSPQDWSTLGLIAARVAFVALLPNTTAVDETLERGVQDVEPAHVADLGGDPVGEEDDGASITTTLPVIPRTATPSDLIELQRQADAFRLPRSRRARGEGRHEVQR